MSSPAFCYLLLFTQRIMHIFKDQHISLPDGLGHVELQVDLKKNFFWIPPQNVLKNAKFGS